MLRVDDRVEEHLLQLLRIAHDERHVGGHDDVGAHAGFLQGAAVQREHALGDVLEIDGLGDARALTREIEQGQHDPPAAHRFGVDDGRALP